MVSGGLPSVSPGLQLHWDLTLALDLPFPSFPWWPSRLVLCDRSCVTSSKGAPLQMLRSEHFLPIDGKGQSAPPPPDLCSTFLPEDRNGGGGGGSGPPMGATWGDLQKGNGPPVVRPGVAVCNDIAAGKGRNLRGVMSLLWYFGGFKVLFSRSALLELAKCVLRVLFPVLL